MPHTVQEAQAALGGMSMAFQAMESALIHLFAKLADPNAATIGIMIGSELSFGKLLKVTDAVCRYRTDQPELIAKLSEIIAESGKLEEKRNSFLHSYYDLLEIGPVHVRFERIKQRLRVGKGHNPDFETYDPEELRRLSQEMYAVVGRAEAFEEALARSGVITSESDDIGPE